MSIVQVLSITVMGFIITGGHHPVGQQEFDAKAGNTRLEGTVAKIANWGLYARLPSSLGKTKGPP